MAFYLVIFKVHAIESDTKAFHVTIELNCHLLWEHFGGLVAIQTIWIRAFERKGKLKYFYLETNLHVYIKAVVVVGKKI